MDVEDNVPRILKVTPTPDPNPPISIGQKIAKALKIFGSKHEERTNNAIKYYNNYLNQPTKSWIDIPKKALAAVNKFDLEYIEKPGAKLAKFIGNIGAPVIDAGLTFVPPQYKIPLYLGNGLYNHYSGIRDYYKGSNTYKPNYGKNHFVYQYWKRGIPYRVRRFKLWSSYQKRKFFGSRKFDPNKDRITFRQWSRMDPRDRADAWWMYNKRWNAFERHNFDKHWEFRKGFGYWGPPYVAWRKHHRNIMPNEYWIRKRFWMPRKK